MTGLRWGGVALGWVVAVLWAKRTAEWFQRMSLRSGELKLPLYSEGR